MKVIKSKILFDGVDERQNCFIGFEDDEIKYVGLGNLKKIMISSQKM
jgi:hypothetical protein